MDEGEEDTTATLDYDMLVGSNSREEPGENLDKQEAEYRHVKINVVRDVVLNWGRW